MSAATEADLNHANALIGAAMIKAFNLNKAGDALAAATSALLDYLERGNEEGWIGHAPAFIAARAALAQWKEAQR